MVNEESEECWWGLNPGSEVVGVLAVVHFHGQVRLSTQKIMFTRNPLRVKVGVTQIHGPFQAVFWQVNVPAVVLLRGGHVEVLGAVAGGGDRGRHDFCAVVEQDVPAVGDALAAGKCAFWLKCLFL